VPDAHAEHLGDALDVKQLRKTARTTGPSGRLSAGSAISSHVPCMRRRRPKSATAHRSAPLPRWAPGGADACVVRLGHDRSQSIAHRMC
jgi:hypothetical protein